MSKTVSETPETAQAPSKLVQKLNSMKPAALSDEKKATVVGRIKIVGAYAAGVATTLAALYVVGSKLNSSAENDETAEVDESEETTED
jgi:hypothetical protein